MEDILAALIAIGFIILVVLFFRWYVKKLHQISLNSLRKRLENGKIKDKQLMRLYRNADKYKNNTFFAILINGVFYKYYLNFMQAQYDMFKAEVDKRGLA